MGQCIGWTIFVARFVNYLKIITQEFGEPFLLLQGLDSLVNQRSEALMICLNNKVATQKVLTPFTDCFIDCKHFVGISRSCLYLRGHLFTKKRHRVAWLWQYCTNSVPDASVYTTKTSSNRGKARTGVWTIACWRAEKVVVTSGVQINAFFRNNSVNGVVRRA